MKYNNWLIDDFAKVVRFDKDDEPGKYGFTKKMHAIWDLVEAEKDIDSAGFEFSEADRAWYDDYIWLYDGEKEARGKPYYFPRYSDE